MRIRWTQPAAQDFESICDYIQEHDGPERAHKVASQIYHDIETLSQFPHLGRQGRKRGTRELVLTRLPLIAIYVVHEDVIEITRILHGAQRYP